MPYCDTSHFDYDFDHSDPDSSVRTLLERFRPDWKERLQDEQLQVEVVAGGFTNQLLVAYFANDDSEKILIRIYGKDTEKLIDRQAELRTLHLLSENNVSGEVYGVFGNGMCYEYVPGETMEREMAIEPSITKLIIEKMVQLHCVYRQQTKRPKAKVEIFDKMRTMLDLPSALDEKDYPAQRTKFPSRQQLHEEINFLESDLNLAENYSPQVFCHNDLYFKNILYERTNHKVKFIDFEYAGLNYQAYDIGNFFNELCGVDDIDYERFPDKVFQTDWLRHYLRSWNTHHNITTDVDDKQVEHLYKVVNKFSSVAHIFWIIWSFQQAASSSIDFDFLTYAGIRLEEYFRRKPERFPTTSLSTSHNPGLP